MDLENIRQQRRNERQKQFVKRKVDAQREFLETLIIGKKYKIVVDEAMCYLEVVGTLIGYNHCYDDPEYDFLEFFAPELEFDIGFSCGCSVEELTDE